MMPAVTPPGPQCAGISTRSRPTHVLRVSLLTLLLGAFCLLSACVNKTPTPDWQINTQTALQSAQKAWLQGNAKVYEAQVRQLRLAASASGQPATLAQVELALCAAQSASLTLLTTPNTVTCPAFVALQAAATPAQKTYFGYLSGQALGAADAALLPKSQQAFVTVAAGAPALAALKSVEDPLSQLVAAGRLLNTGKLDAQTLAVAVETASAQGWRHALVGWLTFAVRDAKQRGDNVATSSYQRQLDVVMSLGDPAKLAGTPSTAPTTKD